MPVNRKDGQQTADQIQQTGLGLPVAKRDIGLMQKAAEATSTANSFNHGVEQQGKEAGVAVNNLKAVPVLDAEGNIVGFTPSK